MQNPGCHWYKTQRIKGREIRVLTSKVKKKRAPQFHERKQNFINNRVELNSCQLKIGTRKIGQKGKGNRSRIQGELSTPPAKSEKPRMVF